MSTHPNAILMVALTPHELARKTYRAILEANGCKDDDDTDFKIGDESYNSFVAESDYEDGVQISAKEGDLVFYDLITYGYGEKKPWHEVEKQKNELEAWARDMCQRFKCDYEIFISANYW